MLSPGIRTVAARLAAFRAANIAPQLGTVFGVVAGVQVAFYVHSVLALGKSEKYYDFSGAITNISGVATAALLAKLPFAAAPAVPQLLLGLVTVWAGRLGYFLFQRIQKDGEDKRFRELKKSAAMFSVPWMIQAIWCFTVPIHSTLASLHYGRGAALLAAEKAGAARATWLAATGPFKPTFLQGLALGGAVLGLAMEALADEQKKAFKEDEANKGKFIDTGLWHYSRHPNYAGEILYQTSAAWLAWLYMAGSDMHIFGLPARWLVWLSPALTMGLLLFVSGIPAVEQHADEKYGDDPAYREYKERTSVLIPWFPSKSKKE